MVPLFQAKGIQHRRACPHTHEQNGTSEWKIQHIVNSGLTILAHASVPLRFWNFAFATIVYNINCLPSRTHDASPHQILFKSPPDLSFLKVFGCLVFPFLRPYNTHKFEFHSTPCCFLGYSNDHLRYVCFDRKANKIYIVRRCRFIEDKFFFSNISHFHPEVAGPTDITNWLTHNPFGPDQPSSASYEPAHDTP